MTRTSTTPGEHMVVSSVRGESVRRGRVFAGANQWSLIVDKPREPRWNMALDRALLSAVVSERSGPTLRFYQWSKPAVTLGFHQKMERVLDVETVEQAGIEVVVRPTGGRAVLHGDDLTYSIALPAQVADGYGITELYRILSEALQVGFRQVGIAVELARGNRGELRPGAPPCFASTARYELVIGGKKIVGSAQRRYRGGVLQQGSIPLRVGRIRPEDLMPKHHRIELGDNRWTTVEDVLGRSIGFETLAHSLATGFSKRLGITLKPRQPTVKELEEAGLFVESDV